MTEGLNALGVRCLESIREHSPAGSYRVIWIDNGSPLPCVSLEDELGRHPHEVIRNTENLGFIKGTNQGIQLSTAPYVVLFNNDCEAAPQWLEKLRVCLVDKVGISGPRSTRKNGWQGLHWARKPFLLSYGDMLAFFCAMIRREVIEKVGLLDESFGMGLGDDNDFCTRTHNAGFRLALAGDLLILHHHHATFKTVYSKEELAAMYDASLTKLISKA
jgi:GT2 family glycosyltransferase